MKDKYLNIMVICVMSFLIFEIDCQAQDVKEDSIKVTNGKLQTVQDSVKLKIKNPTGAMIRSLVFPGLGQWYNNKKFKALIVFCAETGLLANAIYLNQQLVKSTEDWERNFYIENRNISVWWLIGVTLLSLTDAYVDAHLADFDESPILSSIKFQPIVATRDVGFEVSLCFNF
ncbi:hypothetical protein H8E88_08900 [candidate division KSB1 bacterium]|nr:hypothetical protein [candidate division KSB1 bacterium]